jgi:hypothetical protein
MTWVVLSRVLFLGGVTLAWAAFGPLLDWEWRWPTRFDVAAGFTMGVLVLATPYAVVAVRRLFAKPSD